MSCLSANSGPGSRRGARTVLLLCSLLLVGSKASAKVRVTVEDWGLGGAVKSGLWAPLYVELESEEDDFVGVLEVEVDAGESVRPRFAKPVALVANTPARHWIYFRPPTAMWRAPTSWAPGYGFEWCLRDRKERMVLRSRWEPPVMLPAGDSVVAVLRTPEVTRTGLGALYHLESDVRTNLLLVTAGRAPDRALGYQVCDFLVWVNPDPSELTEVAQREALVNYVREGGHLVLAAGAGWQALTESFLAELLPARVTGSEVVTELPALSAYGPPADAGSEIVLLRLEAVEGDVLMRCGDRPVMVRGSVGGGKVTLVGFDPTTSPFIELARRRDFWAEVLGIDLASPELKRAALRSASTALIQPLNDFPGFKPVNIVFVALFLVGYVILIGPVDYLLLKRYKKLHWTWVTFPSIAVISSVLAFWLLSAERVRGTLANTVSVVDASVGGEEVSGTTAMTFLSPRQTRYRVELDGVTSGAVVPREFEVLPGGGPTLGMGPTRCHVLGAGERIEQLLVRIWDAQTLEASWRASAPALPDVQLHLAAGGVRGSLSNTTADTLDEVLLLYAGTVAPLGALAPGQTAELAGTRFQPLARYTSGIMPAELTRSRRGYGWGEEQPQRANAVQAARWLSLFGFAGDGDGRFRRCIRTAEESDAVVFDLAGRLQLATLSSPSEAVVLYSVERPFINILLSGQSPRSWDQTVVRLRVPVGTPEPGEEGNGD